MGQRVSVCSKLKSIDEGEAKASLNRATKLHVLDPKPDDLVTARLKAG